MAMSQLEYIATQWAFVGISLILVVARLAVRTWKRLWRFWLSEVMLIIAVGTFITIVIGTTYDYAKGGVDYTHDGSTSYRKWLVSICLLYDLGFYFPRFSLLAFYHELFPISEEWLRKCLKVVAAFNVCGFVIVAFVDLFWCGSVANNWKFPTECSIISVTDMIKVTWPLGLVAELLVFTLPFGMLKTLKTIPKNTKIALIFIFGLGIVTVGLSIGRYIVTMRAIYSYDSATVGFAEIVSQIIVCAVPALRPLLGPITMGFSKIASLMSLSTTKSDDEERTLHGSHSSVRGKENNVSQMNEVNLPELAYFILRKSLT